MAYMDQERKAVIAAGLKRVMPKDWKWTLAVRHHSTLVLTVSEAPVHLVEEYLEVIRRVAPASSGWHEHKSDYLQVNEYHLESGFEGERLEQMKKIVDAMNTGNHNRSDPMSDYFDVGWYIDINFGRWNKPFKATGQVREAA